MTVSIVFFYDFLVTLLSFKLVARFAGISGGDLMSLTEGPAPHIPSSSRQCTRVTIRSHL